MFAVLLKTRDNRLPPLHGREWTLPAGVRRIAEYSGEKPASIVVLVEVAAGCGHALREMELKGNVIALAVEDMAQGFEMARSVIERRPRSTWTFRHRSGSR